jgi:hypothetical protein
VGEVEKLKTKCVVFSFFQLLLLTAKDLKKCYTRTAFAIVRRL